MTSSCLLKCNRSFSAIFAYCTALALLFLLINLNKYSSISTQATKTVEEVSYGKSIGSTKGYLDLCTEELKAYILKSQSLRKGELADPKSYASMIFQLVAYKDVVVGRCIEKIYTLSRDSFNLSFAEFKSKMSDFLDGDYFTGQFNKIYHSMFEPRDLPAPTLKKVFKRMLAIMKSADFRAFEQDQENVPGESLKFIQRFYLVDKIGAEFGVSEIDINASSALKTDRELKMMFSDISKQLE